MPEKGRFPPHKVKVRVYLNDEQDLMQELQFPDGTKKVRVVNFGAKVCEEGLELIDDLTKQGRLHSEGTIYEGSQALWQAHVNMRLGSRGQMIDFSMIEE